ncbi:MAG: hypothetical protein METHSR3v1_490004 [Methanothrix sp.]|nr:MAG: hypothetical protein METHSR3v1_490004 [Methanothrix sp.]
MQTRILKVLIALILCARINEMIGVNLSEVAGIDASNFYPLQITTLKIRLGGEYDHEGDRCDARKIGRRIS